ncbi:MAG: hypothetical protein ABEK02_01915 [Haloquadratum sp.]
MKSTRRDALTAGGIVLALAAAGLAVFLFSGSSNAVLFFAAGVPLILILGGVVWHRRVTRTSGETSPRIESMTEDLADDLEELLVTYERLDKETPWDASQYADQVRDIKRDLENRGFEIHADGDDVSVEIVDYEMGVGAISRHQQNIQSVLDEGLKSGFIDAVESQTDEMRTQLDRLVDENLLDPAAADEIRQVDAAGRSPREATDALADQRETFRDLLGEAVARVHDVAGEPVIDRGTLDDDVQQGRYERAVSEILDADVGDGGLSQKRRELSRLIETVQSSVATEYAPQSRFEKLDSIQSELDELDSVYQTDRLDDELRPRTLATCAEIVSDLRDELTGYLETFSEPDVPSDYFERPAVLERSLTEELQNASDLEAFRTRWVGMVDDLADALDAAAAREGALLAYDDVVGEVERALTTEGEVDTSDVPYDPAEPIMRLYAYRNDDVTFLESRPALTQGADVAGQEFDLTVDVQLDPPETHDVTVEATIRDETRGLTRTVDGAASFAFDPLLGGDATVTAEVEDDDRYSPQETEVMLDRDRTVELTLSEETAIDRLCEGNRTDAELILDEVAGDLAATYERNQYLTAEMDIGVQDDYKACVLALWADDNGLSVRTEDDEVLVYDRQRMRNQLTDLIEKKLSDGDELPYEDIRERYLSAPASDGLIRDVLAQAETDVDFECTADSVVSA